MENKIRLPILRRRSDFLFILKNGQRVRPSDWLLMNFILKESGDFRCGWTLPRQVGSAVVRNRIRRMSRVYFYSRLKAGETLPVDINLVFRKCEENFYKKLSYESFASVLDKGWKQVQRRVQQSTEALSSPTRPNVQGSGGRPSRRSVPV